MASGKFQCGRRGVSLVELMIAMLILAIVCVAWLEIIGVQSARREARRREAVERLAGMMDAFMYEKKTSDRYYVMSGNEFSSKKADEKKVYQLFSDGSSPIGYQLRVVKTADDIVKDDMLSSDWGNKKWLVGKLYDKYGDIDKDDIGDPFFVLPVYLGL